MKSLIVFIFVCSGSLIPSADTAQANINKFSPVFSQNNYIFVASRNAFTGTYLGQVFAYDDDIDAQTLSFRLDNIAFMYLAQFPKEGRAEVYLNSKLPVGTISTSSIVHVRDGGTPERESQTYITLYATDLPMLTTFCAVVNSSRVRICWKVPIVGSDFPSFRVNLIPGDGGPVLTYNLTAADVTSYEACITVNQTLLRGANIVTVYAWSLNENNLSTRSPKFVLKISKPHSEYQGRLPSDCLTFNVCNLIEPCRNEGYCAPRASGRYRCTCRRGWIGLNCEIRDLCVDDQCKNGGTCAMTGDVRKCTCSPKFMGPNCEYLNQCFGNPCGLNGRCTAGNTGNATCECRRLYTGNRCQYQDMCQIEPCENHATCSRVNDTAYKCHCRPGFRGDICNEIDICGLVPEYCLYRGKCESLDNGTAVCQCDKGWKGQRCETYDYCVKNVCLNGGNCTYLGHELFQCDCAHSYYGDICEKYNKCYDLPCLNDANCTRSDDSYMCHCRRGFHGTQCQLFNKCVENPCKRGSVCRNVSHNEYECNCTEQGTYGKNCEWFNSCVLKPCRNNATCTNTSAHDAYNCRCGLGWTGKRCESFNHCEVGVCGRNGSCTFIDHNKYSCQCDDGYYGDRCERYNQCNDLPCQNSGSCSNTSDSYNCDCSNGFHGDNCEFYNKCVEKPCINGHCNNVSHDVYECECAETKGYYGKNCELRNGCFSFPCYYNSTCFNNSVVGGYSCRCDPDMYSGVQCEKLEHCPFSTTSNALGNYTWPATSSGHLSRVKCEMGPDDKFIERECLTGVNVTWADPVDTGCMSAGEQAALAALNGLKDMTSDSSSMTSEQVGQVADTLNNVVQYTFRKVEIATVMTDVVNNVLQVDKETLRQGQLNKGTNDKLVSVLDNYTSGVMIQDGNNVSLISQALNVIAIDVNVADVEDEITLASFFGQDGSTVGPQISLSANLLTSLNGTTRLQLVAYGNDKFFLDPRSSKNLTRHIVSLRIRDAVVNSTNDSVVSYSIPVSEEERRNFTCVFWDETELRWSTNGVYITILDDNTTVCESTHLTSFSILMDPDPGRPIPLIHEQIQTYFTYIGCGVSIISLLFTIITYALFRCLHGDKSGKILLNICTSMLLLNAVFVLGSLDSSAYGEQLCMAIAIALHYFLLTTLLWMLIEAVNMYQFLIVVFTDYERFFMPKRIVAGWGIPAVAVAITVAVSRDNYRTQDAFCFISHASPVAFYAAVLAPALLILICNVVVFVRVTIVVLRRPKVGKKGKNGKQPTVTKTQIRGAIAVMVVLGVTWVLGPLAIGEAKVFFTYAFTVANSMQGFLLFLFRCAMNVEARMAWHQLLTTGTLKKRRGVIVSTTAVTSFSSESRGKLPAVGPSLDRGKSRTKSGSNRKTIVEENNCANNKINNYKT